MNSKKCNVCNEIKKYEEFNKGKQYKDGLQYSCRKCSNNRNKSHYKSNKHRQDIKNILWKQNNLPRYRDLILKNNYGITLEDYNNILEKQNGVCAICKQSETTINNKTNKPNRLSVDHNHDTNEIRGLLCNRCNRSIGMLKDSIDIMCHAIIYLNKSNKQGAA